MIETLPAEKYSLQNFLTDFPDDKACLERLRENRWPDGIPCKVCGKVTNHHYIQRRKSYSCQRCGHHVHPTAGTIFHKSSTPLTLWFYAIYLVTQERGRISARQLQRELGVTYKTAWRMVTLIRRCLDDNDSVRFFNSGRGV